MICLGDLNLLHLCDNAKQGRALLDICDVYDLHCLINEPTRISLTKESCIGVILTDTPALVLESGTLEPGLSDHLWIYTVLNIKSKKPKTTFRTSRSFKEFNADLFNVDLQSVPFNVAYVFDDIDDICWAWEKLYTDVLDRHAPLRSMN